VVKKQTTKNHGVWSWRGRGIIRLGNGVPVEKTIIMKRGRSLKTEVKAMGRHQKGEKAKKTLSGNNQAGSLLKPLTRPGKGAEGGGQKH